MRKHSNVRARAAIDRAVLVARARARQWWLDWQPVSFRPWIVKLWNRKIVKDRGARKNVVCVTRRSLVMFNRPVTGDLGDSALRRRRVSVARTTATRSRGSRTLPVFFLASLLLPSASTVRWHGVGATRATHKSMQFYKDRLLSPGQLKRLSEHKYSCTSKSLLDGLLQPWWDWLVSKVPLWLAPNLITVLGLIVNIVTTLILIYYSPDARAEVGPTLRVSNSPNLSTLNDWRGTSPSFLILFKHCRISITHIFLIAKKNELFFLIIISYVQGCLLLKMLWQFYWCLKHVIIALRRLRFL